jgi:arylsulfatase A-like enzyme
MHSTPNAWPCLHLPWCLAGAARALLSLALLTEFLLPIREALADARTSRSGRPNIIFILADDLGYGDLGCYGQRLIQTPVLDRMAAEGMRFTQFYAGSTVCAPSRSVLMTGLHAGHTRVRGNASSEAPGAQMLRDKDVTVAEVLKRAGYTTGLVGKWGLGMPGDEGVPNRQGFDYFFGFLSQHHAHNHYPDFLWRNDQRVLLPNGIVPVGQDGAGYATNRVQYAGDLFAQEALDFVTHCQDRPFFLYLALTVPHANNERFRALRDGQEVPDYGPYADKDWPDPDKGLAAMITRMDAQIGRLLEHLQTFGLARQTLVMFSSDNGPHKEGGNRPDFFDANGPLRGLKRDLTDGGIRVPLIAWWPGRIPTGTASDHVGYLGDLMATWAELGWTKPPRKLDSISLVPTLLGRPAKQKEHEYLYWEFHERGFQQALRLGDWKAIRLGTTNAIALYDLKTDLGETRNVASAYPNVVRKVEKILQRARTDNPYWKVKQ